MGRLAPLKTVDVTRRQWPLLARNYKALKHAATADDLAATATALQPHFIPTLLTAERLFEWFNTLDESTLNLLIALHRECRDRDDLERVVASVRAAVNSISVSDVEAVAAFDVASSVGALGGAAPKRARSPTGPQPVSRSVKQPPAAPSGGAAMGVAAVSPFVRRRAIIEALDGGAPAATVEPTSVQHHMTQQSVDAVERAIAVTTTVVRSAGAIDAKVLAKAQPVAKSSSSSSSKSLHAPVKVSVESDDDVDLTTQKTSKIEPNAPASVARRPPTATQTTAASVNSATAALLAKLENSSPTQPTSSEGVRGVIRRSDVSGQNTCRVCGESGGDIDKCRFCQHYVHEVCGGPRPDVAAALKRCEACSRALGLKGLTSSDDDDEDSDEDESTDTSLDGFIASDEEDDFDYEALDYHHANGPRGGSRSGTVTTNRSSSVTSTAPSVEAIQSTRASGGGRGAGGGRGGRGGRARGRGG